MILINYRLVFTIYNDFTNVVGVLTIFHENLHKHCANKMYSDYNNTYYMTIVFKN